MTAYKLASKSLRLDSLHETFQEVHSPRKDTNIQWYMPVHAWFGKELNALFEVN